MGKSLQNQSSQKARFSAARLAAVQAVYQMLVNDEPSVRAVVEEHASYRLGKPVEGAPMVQPDKTLFTGIVSGVAERRSDLDELLKSAANREAAVSGEPLLQALLLCGAWELLACHETDAPIIISDYINVCHAFFDQGEARLVNGMLDRIKDFVRDGSHDA